MYSIYKITINDKIYIGYTSRAVRLRISEHIKMARNGWKHNSKLYPALKANKCKLNYKTIATYDSEFQALCREIAEIHNLDKNISLNVAPGGHGTTMVVKTRINPKTHLLEYKVAKKGIKGKLSKYRDATKRIYKKSSSRRRQNNRRR